MNLEPDFKDLLAVFAAHGVEYLIVGGYAVSFHAEPRYTKDLDVWINPAAANLARAREALEQFGAPAELLAELDSASQEDVLWMGVPPVRIDLLKGVPGGAFDDAFAHRVLAEWSGITVSLIAKEDLIAIKKASGRPQDLADVGKLETSPG